MGCQRAPLVINMTNPDTAIEAIAANERAHCPGEPTINPFRLSSHGTAYAVQVCCCGETMQYVEIEVEIKRQEEH